MERKTELFGWFKTERKFTVDEVQELVDQVKVFNAGCIDEYLSDHVDQVFIAWLEDLKK
jgi:hypothetical protein